MRRFIRNRENLFPCPVWVIGADLANDKDLTKT